MASTDPPERDPLVLLRESVERGFDEVRDRFDGVDRDIAALVGNQEALAANQAVFAANQEVLAANQEALAANQQAMAAKQDVMAANQAVFAADLRTLTTTTVEHFGALEVRMDTLFGALADLRGQYNAHTEHPPGV